MPERPVLQVALPTPAADSYDYLPPPGYAGPAPQAGMRVLVGFGKRRLIGMIIARADCSRVPADKLRPVLKVVDARPILNPADIALLRWASRYYHHPLGEVISASLPKRLRQGHTAEINGISLWRVSPSAGPPDNLRCAPRQRALMALLMAHPNGLDAARMEAHVKNWRQPLAAMVKKGLVTQISRPCLEAAGAEPAPHPSMNSDQTAAAAAVLDALGTFAPFVLEGITGSGKTEVYLRIIERVVERGNQALVLVPEIALTPQLMARFQARFRVPIAIMHSSLPDVERHCAWHMARTGGAPIVIGTRSAVFTPLAAAGIIVVDEEHDGSFKQQEGFRYHARDLAVIRASLTRVPVVLGSATPSLETLWNVERGRYRRLRLPTRAGQATLPAVEVIDVRARPLEDGLSAQALAQVRQHLEAGAQVLVFLNRRGYAPALLCHDCGWAASCERCDARLTLHAARQRLCCHHCGAQQPVMSRCPSCGSRELLRLGEGTERVERTLKALIPTVSIVRVDRDTTRRKGALQSKLTDIARGTHRLLIGTQMLSKGHDFPDVTLVVILNVDQNLYSSDFRAAERAAQLIVQVAGRAGRGDRPGKVLLQTHLPDHPLLKSLLQGGYRAFGHAALSERRCAGLPPCRHMALLRADAVRREPPMTFLRSAAALLNGDGRSDVDLLGPAPAPMERRAGRYRAQLLLIAHSRSLLQQLLGEHMPSLGRLPGARKVRWILDVDPIETL